MLFLPRPLFMSYKARSKARLPSKMAKAPSSKRHYCKPKKSPFFANANASPDVNGALGSIDRTLALVFTCTKCNTRSTRTFSHHSYTKGIVIVQCPECKSNHLIADNLGWFEGFEGKNIEEVLAARGETVRREIDPRIDVPEQIMEDINSFQTQKAKKRSEAKAKLEERIASGEDEVLPMGTEQKARTIEK